jgi:hypothetical protein
MIKYILTFLLLFLAFNLNGQEGDSKKELKAIRIKTPVLINGDLSDEQWNNIPGADSFLQISPYNGQPAIFETEVKIAYDDNAIYIGAILHDPNPDSIVQHLSKRDRTGLTDYFGIHVDPFNDGLSAYGFFVNAAGVQTDLFYTGGGNKRDFDWDAVWNSEVAVTNDGWVVEMSIPYSSLRFSSDSLQQWGINFFRNIQRYRQYVSWNYIDRKKPSTLNQAGLLRGIKNIVSPLRLSFTPYMASYVRDLQNEKGLSYSIKGGLDMKYGINESFTLDMMLIPDFGQVQTDDKILNLSPFEVYYDEKRPFFMEGTELFQKAGIFYSRRIGGEPHQYDEVDEVLKENEVVLKNPTESQLLNAAKITGKTSSGLAIGGLNALTLASYARIRDTVENKERTYKTQPFTNYNVVAFDQSLKNNSYASIINTNVKQAGKSMANVTGTEFKLADRTNTYAILARGAVSQKYQNEKDSELGYYYDVDLAKISGNFKFTFTQRVESDTYDPNDLGFIRQNNEFTNRFKVGYYIYDPFWRMLNWYNSFSITRNSLYNPMDYINTRVAASTFTTFSNYYSMELYMAYYTRKYDYFEPRVDGEMVIYPPRYSSYFWISSDYRKRFAMDLAVSGYFFRDDPYAGYRARIEPRFRVNDKLLLVLENVYDLDNNQYGYADKSESADTVYFGRRDRTTIENTLVSDYAFNNKTTLSFRLRHYWARVNYSNFMYLEDDGYLSDASGFSTDNQNYNAFNIDMVYTWNFAPGSEMSLVWKNAISSDENKITNSYHENITNVLSSSQTNTISLKILYYLDFQSLKDFTGNIL